MEKQREVDKLLQVDFFKILDYFCYFVNLQFQGVNGTSLPDIQNFFETKLAELKKNGLSDSAINKIISDLDAKGKAIAKILPLAAIKLKVGKVIDAIKDAAFIRQCIWNCDRRSCKCNSYLSMPPVL